MQEGLWLIAWGLYKKMVIADNLAQFVQVIFENPSDFGGSSLLLGGIFFTIQIYADFSGYSDIAIGTARLFGFNLSRNFNYPLFSQSIPELWRRWHITLTSWLYEAVFTPLTLAFRDYGKFGLILAFYIYLILIGFWHGANWTFIIFGAFHGTIFLPYILRGTVGKKNKMIKGPALPTIRELLNMSVTFFLFMVSCIIFRAENVSHAMEIFRGMFDHSIIEIPSIVSLKMIVICVFILALFVMEWIHRDKQHGLQLGANSPWLARYSLYFVITVSIMLFRGGTQDFIYFQF